MFLHIKTYRTLITVSNDLVNWICKVSLLLTLLSAKQSWFKRNNKIILSDSISVRYNAHIQNVRNISNYIPTIKMKCKRAKILKQWIIFKRYPYISIVMIWPYMDVNPRQYFTRCHFHIWILQDLLEIQSFVS